VSGIRLNPRIAWAPVIDVAPATIKDMAEQISPGAAETVQIGKVGYCRSRCLLLETGREASWRSGYAADCKSVYSGSIPDEASIHITVGLALSCNAAAMCRR
jgi:hypothetical protein